MRLLEKSLIYKIGAAVLLVECLVLTSLGLFYTETFSREVDRYLTINVQLPGKLMNRQLLRYESVGSEEVMKELVGEEFLDAMVIGAGGRIYYAYHPEMVGKNVSDTSESLPGILERADEPILTQGQEAIVSVTPLRAYRGAKPFFHVYVKADKHAALARKHRIAAMFILGSALCIIITSLAIIGFSRKHVTKPLADLARTADALRRGNLDIAVPTDRRDEIGSLAQNFDAMRHAIKQQILELEQTNLELEEKEGRIQALVEALPDRIVLFDWHGRYLDIYPGFEENMALKSDRLQGRLVHECHPAELADKVLSVVRRTISTGRGQILEYSLDSTSGKTWFETRTSRIGSEDGEKGTVVWVARDITYRRQMERRLRRSKEEAERMNRRLRELDRTKSTLVSSVSHELRTPLTSLLGFSKLILKNFSKHFWPLAKGDHKLLTKGSQIVENLNILLHEGERLSRLIGDVLDLNKIEMGYTEWHVSRTSPAELVRRAATAVSGQFDNNPAISLVTEVGEDLPDIAVDPDRMIQVLLNLLTNAAKFTDKGTVTLSASATDPGLIRFQVTDTGPGIPREDLDRVFDIFHQLGEQDPAGDKPQGAGLGLAICREIVAYHNGTIWVESEMGRGASFIIELPTT
jgi:PAS domain S-box-containing protein